MTGDTGDKDKLFRSDHPTMGGFLRALDTVLFQPVYWFREKVVEPMQGERQAWYHRKYPRVTGIEDCYVEDVVCREEANTQFKRDWLVEEEILHILRERMHDCFFYEKGTGLAHMQVSPQPLIDLKENSTHVCKPIYDAYQNAAENYFIKYGEISHYYGRAEDALAKQKHRVMWERRHGPVGSGMKVEVKED